MKKLILIFIFLSTASAYAQSVVPQVTVTPVTGFRAIVEANPYVVVEKSFDGGVPFTPESRYMKTPSNVPGFNKKNVESHWDNGNWVDHQIFQDTFMLNAQGKLLITIEDHTFNYPGFQSRVKLRSFFTYNTGGKPEMIKVQNANPPTGNSYSDYYTWKLHYNASGLRDFDTMAYNGRPVKYAYEYRYNSAGHVDRMIQYDVANGIADSAQVTMYSYTATGKLNTSQSKYYDSDLGEWRDGQKDSIEYDTDGRVANRSFFALYTIEEVTMFLPYLVEFYKYNADGNLEEIIGVTKNSTDTVWSNSSKHTILYDNGKAKLGFIYEADEAGNWSLTPDKRLLFAEPTTGIREQRNDLISAMYPVPAADELFIDLRSAEQHDVKIYDMNGRGIAVPYEVSGTRLRFDVSALHAGIYLLKVSDGSSFTSERIMIGQ